MIDASTAHRVADGWTFGFPEIVGRETVARAARVSNPERVVGNRAGSVVPSQTGAS